MPSKNQGVYFSDAMRDQPMCEHCRTEIVIDRWGHYVRWACDKCGRCWDLEEIEFPDTVAPRTEV